VFLAQLTPSQDMMHFLGVKTLPVFFAYKEGKEIGRVQGAFPAKLLVSC